LKYTLDSWRLVKAGTTQAQRRLFFSLPKERSKLEILGVRATPRELAVRLGVKESDVVTMMDRFAGGEVSLDMPAHPGEAGTIGDSLSAAPVIQPDVQVETTEFTQTLKRKLTGTRGDGTRRRGLHQPQIAEELRLGVKRVRNSSDR
jgi:RNA polymerase sigma-32 factor